MDYLKEVEKAAKEVLSILKEDYSEEVYEEALAHELRLRKIPYERQRNFEIIYRGYKVGSGRADLILNPLWYGKGGKEIVCELKKVKKITDAHKRQVQVYMISLNIDKGIVLNFGDEIIIEKINKPKRELDYEVDKPKKSKKKIFDLLQEVAHKVYNYFGVEFLYREGKGEESPLNIFTNAIGVELRLNGIEYSQVTFPICYKHQEVGSFDFDFVFSNGEITNVYSYKKEEEIDENLAEVKFYLKLFRLKKGYLICFPAIEGKKVLVKEISF